MSLPACWCKMSGAVPNGLWTAWLRGGFAGRRTPVDRCGRCGGFVGAFRRAAGLDRRSLGADRDRGAFGADQRPLLSGGGARGPELPRGAEPACRALCRPRRRARPRRGADAPAGARHRERTADPRPRAGPARLDEGLRRAPRLPARHRHGRLLARGPRHASGVRHPGGARTGVRWHPAPAPGRRGRHRGAHRPPRTRGRARRPGPRGGAARGARSGELPQQEQGADGAPQRPGRAPPGDAGRRRGRGSRPCRAAGAASRRLRLARDGRRDPGGSWSRT